MSNVKVQFSLTKDKIKSLLKTDPQKFAHLAQFAETGIPFEGQYDFGDNLEGAVTKVGAAVVYNYYRMAEGLRIGGRVRDMLAANKTAAEIQAWLSSPEAKPGLISRTRGPKKSETEVYLEALKKLSPEQQKAKLAELKQQYEAMMKAGQ